MKMIGWGVLFIFEHYSIFNSKINPKTRLPSVAESFEALAKKDSEGWVTIRVIRC